MGHLSIIVTFAQSLSDLKVEHTDLTKNHQLCTSSNSILHIYIPSGLDKNCFGNSRKVCK